MKQRAEPGTGNSIFLSVLLHGALVAVLAGAYFFLPRKDPPPQRLAIEASVVTAPGRMAPPPAPAPPPDPVPEPEPVPEPAPPEPQVDEERVQREAREAREAEEARVAEERRLAEEREATQRRESEAREKAEKAKAEREKAAREKAEREKLERERKAVEQARVKRESDLNAQIAAEEKAAALRSSGQMNLYIAQIAARIERAWIKPPSARVGLECEVRVTQTPGGTVTAVQVGRCNGDETVKQSIEAAVYRASPLPLPSDPALFDRNLIITFRPEV